VCANWLHTRQASMAGARASTVREFCNFLPYGQEGPAFRPNILACSLSLCWVIPWQSMALHPVTRGWSLRFRVTPSSHIHRFMWICFIFIVILSTQLEVLFAMCKSGWCVLKYQWLRTHWLIRNEVFCEWRTSAWKPLWLLQLSASKIMKEVPASKSLESVDE